MTSIVTIMRRVATVAALGIAMLPGLSTATPNEPEPKGMIVMFRTGAIMGAAGACPFRYGGRQIVELGRGKYAEWPVPPGRYLIANKKYSVEVNVAAGETRYVRCFYDTGWLIAKAVLQLSDETSFDRSKYERKDPEFLIQ